MWHGNLDAIVASHQDTILSSAEVGDAYGQPYADRQQGHREGESGYVRQHPLPIITRVFAVALVARQIRGDFEPMDKRGVISALGEGRPWAWPKLEHAVLFFRWGRYDRSLGSHRCQLQSNSTTLSTPALYLEVKIKTARPAKLTRRPCRGTCCNRFERGYYRRFRGCRCSVARIERRYDRKFCGHESFAPQQRRSPKPRP
jgi:hypothetical protein